MSFSDDPLLHQHRHNLLYHVPQHSLREKLRFQPDASSHLFPSGTALLQIQPPQGSFSLTLSPTQAPAVIQPLGPFTGYAAVLNRSRFLAPARQLLEEACQVARGVAVAGSSTEDMLALDYEVGSVEQQWNNAGLISMIEEVCRRYRIYYQQVQTVVASFEMVAGFSRAAPHVSLALKSMSKSFKCLKNTMSNRLHYLDRTSSKNDFSRSEISTFGVCPQQNGSNFDAYRQPHIWRPQRGLPESAVSLLRAWLFEHFLHPYPTDVDKQMLAKQTGLTRNQVSNWFINARVRLWKPMVEEIHNLETRQLQKTIAAADNKILLSHKQPLQLSSSTATTGNQPPHNHCIRRSQNSTSRSFNNEFSHIQDPCNYAHIDLSGDSIRRSVAGSVSLSLGLHQNSGIRMSPSETLPLNVDRRFGFEDCGDTFVVGAFEGQDRRFGKEGGGHLLHDFVG